MNPFSRLRGCRLQAARVLRHRECKLQAMDYPPPGWGLFGSNDRCRLKHGVRAARALVQALFVQRGVVQPAVPSRTCVRPNLFAQRRCVQTQCFVQPLSVQRRSSKPVSSKPLLSSFERNGVSRRPWTTVECPATPHFEGSSVLPFCSTTESACRTCLGTTVVTHGVTDALPGHQV